MNSISVKTAADLIHEFRYGRLQWPLHLGHIVKLLSGHNFGKPWRFWLKEIENSIATGDLMTIGVVHVRPVEMNVMQAQGRPAFVESPLVEEAPLRVFLALYLDDPTVPLHPLVKARLCASTVVPASAAILPLPEPAAPSVGHPTPFEGDSGDAVRKADDDLDLSSRNKRRIDALLEQARAMEIDLLNPKRGDRARLAKSLNLKFPGRFGIDCFNTAWATGLSLGLIKSLKDCE